MKYLLDFEGFLHESWMSNARDFENIMSKAVKPAFQRELAKYDITEPSKQTDEYLVGLMNGIFDKNDIKYDFYYLPKMSKKDYNEIGFEGATYDPASKVIKIYMQPGCSKFFFPDNNKTWNNYLTKFSTKIKHEKLHLGDLSKIKSDVIEKGNFGSTYDVGGLLSNPTKKNEDLYRDGGKFFDAINNKNISVVDFITMNNEDPEKAKKLVSSVFRNKYKDDDRYSDFIDILQQRAYGEYMHASNPVEVRALSQEIIRDFLTSGLKKIDIINIIKSNVTKTPSKIYNSIAGLVGVNSEQFRPIRHEIGKKMLQLPS